jgi:hypothetical protein
LNFETIDIVSQCLGRKMAYQKTSEYFHEAATFCDYRNLANGKKDFHSFESYTQVFHEKHGFLNNLSVLDVLFNEGRYALDYLKQQKL